MIKKVSLFKSKRDFFIFCFFLIFILSYSLLIEFNNYKNLTRFDSQVLQATVLKQYDKNKITKKFKVQSYQMLKLKSSQGFSFYSGMNTSKNSLVGQTLTLELYAQKINFYEYISSFYAYSNILGAQDTLVSKLNATIANEHKDSNATKIYQALYSATPLSKDLQQTFSNLGISHLFAISGFHLGVLSSLLLLLFTYPYKFLQNRFFPYRSATFDLFILVGSLLLVYLLFLNSPASLLRAFTLLVLGFIFYDRGIKVISMVTLLTTVLLLLVFFPRLFFELGFWLSVSGVYYIFLFLVHFKHLSKLWQFILIPFWVYQLMLPFSLAIFENFSIYHPLSIIWTSLFTLFYPLSIFLHLAGFGDLLDGGLQYIVDLGKSKEVVILPMYYLYLHILLSLSALYKKSLIFTLLFYNIVIFSLLYFGIYG